MNLEPFDFSLNLLQRLSCRIPVSRIPWLKPESHLAVTYASQMSSSESITYSSLNTVYHPRSVLRGDDTS